MNEKYHANLCGIDEAGRGPWAGDMVIAGVVLSKDIDGLNDSKKLSAKKRELLFEQIKQNCAFHIVKKSSLQIDEKGLSLCLKEALQEIVSILKADKYIMDGNTNFSVDNVESLIKGDQKEASISAASILAKVTRDYDMCNLNTKYDKYQFQKHKGYGTALHKEMIKKYGLSDIHRHSYKINLN
jgi:ribonuclease HII